MDRFQAMQVFVRIVELGSFTKAADTLNLPRATVTHTIKQLETRLGARLLQRTTRHVSATPEGQAYYQRCVQLIADMEDAESVFSEALTKPRGKVRVDMHGSQARLMLAPALPEFFARYPDIELEIGASDRPVDLVREGVDCVLRGGELQDSSLVARRVGLMHQVTCASSAYLRQHGEPGTLDDLKSHEAVNYFSALTGKTLPFEFVVDGELVKVGMRSKVSVNHADTWVACCEAGLGLIQVPRYHVAPLLKAGTLREVLPQWQPPPLPLSVLYPHQRLLSPRVRAFVEWVAELVGRQPF